MSNKKGFVLKVLFVVSFVWCALSTIILVSRWSKRRFFENPVELKTKQITKEDIPIIVEKNEKGEKTKENLPKKNLKRVEFNKNGYPTDNGISPELNHSIIKKEVNHGKWKQIFMTMPAFHWRIPSGLDAKSAEWFWKQDENMRHFLDANISMTGVVRVIENGKFGGYFDGHSNQTHYINVASEPQFTDSPEFDTAMYITKHEVEYFQHFLDNGVPHIALMLMATGIPPSDVTFVMSSWNTQTIPNILKRWGFKTVLNRGGSISAKRLILPEIVPVINPLYHEQLRIGMKLDYSNANKVVFISRTSSDTSKNTRIISNQNELEKQLRNRFGNNFVLFRPSDYSFEKTLELFQKTTMIIGAHGGAMYNALFSGPDATMIEIMPVESSGLYGGQGSGHSMPPFAHLAMYTNAMVMGQEFYRFYAVGGSSFNVDVQSFMEWLEKIPAAQI